MKDRLVVLMFITTIVVTGVFLAWPLFFGEYDTNSASIGIAHIINAGFYKRFGWYVWNPFWYAGFPAHLTYPILSPMIYSFLSSVSGVTVAQSYRILNALVYVLLPVSVFFLTKCLTKKNIPAIFASVIFAFAPSFNYFLVPTLGEVGWAIDYIPWRLSVLLDYGEGPHMMSLLFIPFAVVSYLSLLKKPTRFRLVGTAILIGIIILINLFSAYSLIFFLLVVFFSEIALGNAKSKFVNSVVLGLFIFGFVSFGYDLSMIDALSKTGYIHPENKFHIPEFTRSIFSLFLGIPAVVILFEVVKGKKKFQMPVLVGGWFLVFFSIPFLFYGYDIWIGSQPNRYMPELNMVGSMIVGVVLYKIIEIITNKMPKKVRPASLILFSGGILAVVLLMSRNGMLKVGDYARANESIESTDEYVITKWVTEHINTSKGERVYMSGSPAFFANEFGDVMQIRGDADNGQPNPWWADVSYQLNRGEDARLALGWLDVYNISYLVVPVSATTPYYDFENLDRFSSLEKATDINGFHILKVEGEHNIIQAVDSIAVESLAPFTHDIKPVLDKDGVNYYLEAIRPPSDVGTSFVYQYESDPSKVSINISDANKNTGILFKSNYDKGWSAKVVEDGKSVDIVPAGPNFMLIKPNKAGNYSIELLYKPPATVYVGYAVTFATMLIAVYYVFTRPSSESKRPDENVIS